MDNILLQKEKNIVSTATVGFLLLVALAGCTVSQSGGGKPLNVSNLGTTPLPVYRPGTTFVYSDGTWEKVTAVDGSIVSWINHKGSPSMGPADFTLPRTEWQSSTHKGERWSEYDSGLLAGSTPSLWPLHDRNSVSFNEFGRSVPKNSLDIESATISDKYWRCEVDGAETVSVGAGTFNSWRITCTRYSDNSARQRKRPREYKTWFYAPVVNHWVLEIRDYKSKKSEDKRKELVAVLPDLTRFAKNTQSLGLIRQNFQDTLEHNGTGVEKSYTEPGNNLKITTIPRKTLKHSDGKVCRQYEQQMSFKNENNTYFGIACRESSGLWKVPRRS